MRSLLFTRLAVAALAIAAVAGTRALAQPTGATVMTPVERRSTITRVVPPPDSATLRAPQMKVIADLERVRADRRAAGDAAGEAEALNAIGAAQQRLGDPQKALAAYAEALRLARAGAQPVAERAAPPADAERARARPADRTAAVGREVAGAAGAVAPTRPVRERNAEATALARTGALRAAIGERSEAIVNLEAALAIRTDLKDRQGEALVLGTAAAVHQDVGQNRKALELLAREVPIRRELGDGGGEASALRDMARLHRAVGQNDQAASSLEQSLQAARRSGNRVLEARAMAERGALRAVTSRSRSEKRRGLGEIDRALVLSRRAHDREGEANALHERGAIQRSLGDRAEAIRSFRGALALRRATRQAPGEAETLATLSAAVAKSSPAFASFLAKKAVRTYAAARQERRGLDRDLRRSFPAVISAYRAPTSSLLSQGRLAEARQLLVHLKQLEVDRAVRGGGTSPAGEEQHPTVPGFTPEEREAEARYEEALGPITEVGAEWLELFENPPPEGDDAAKANWERRMKELQEQLERAREEFDRFLERLAGELPAGRAADVREEVGLKTTLRELGAVAIYTYVGESDTWAMLVTPSVEKGFALGISPAELRRKVAELRTAISDRGKDPRPQAKALYDALVAPMKPDLDGARAKTIVWWLDGPLRYAPLAALWDGEKWLVERYRNVLFTTASVDRLPLTPAPHWTVLGLGVSKAHAPLVALPGVKAELEAVVREERAGERGILAGRRLLDGAFTRPALLAGLSQGAPVVHIASHYVFRPVRSQTETIDPDPSYLLLGDGNHLTLSELDLLPPIFNKVDLVALSACDTAIGRDAPEDAVPGAELDGLARVAQQKGAKAVLATLWSVPDASTPALMREFYRRREEGGGRTKAAALQEAQIAMLRGELAPGADGVPDDERGGTVDRPPSALPGWTHPFHWAPFILLGNWL